MHVQKHLQFVGRNEKLLLWCAQMTKCCGGWTKCCANVNSGVRNAPKRLRKTVKPLLFCLPVVECNADFVISWWMQCVIRSISCFHMYQTLQKNVFFCSSRMWNFLYALTSKLTVLLKSEILCNLTNATWFHQQKNNFYSVYSTECALKQHVWINRHQCYFSVCLNDSGHRDTKVFPLTPKRRLHLSGGL